ncbi:hypothetical protein DKX38_026793 [Salix brachista]|uniref:ER lumen protein-retaining receptor n=1 Tax=Salix brachista TaxID=2182728 RepID=A0A5N5JFN6_9ROSI|nr:hypothetical protein DKX38_026793 [Salix brachista]
MNIFRLAGDMTHLASVLVLLLKIHTIKSCAGILYISDDVHSNLLNFLVYVQQIEKEKENPLEGIKSRICISLKTQELYALVFASRYLDIFYHYVSFYNTMMKLIFLGSSFSIVWYIRRHKLVRRSYDKDHDTFRHYFIVLPCLLLALLIHEKFTFRMVMWTFSLYLEAVAILPQLVLLQRTRNIDNLTGQYGIQSIIHIKLGLSLLHRATLCALDNLDIRTYSDIAVCRFLLLLFPELEEQCEARVTGMSKLWEDAFIGLKLALDFKYLIKVMYPFFIQLAKSAFDVYKKVISLMILMMKVETLLEE